MKVILVPTDFSEVSENAVNYAAEIAHITNAKLILFHVYHLPVVVSEAPMFMPDFTVMEADCMDSLREIAKNIEANHGKKLAIECVCKCGFAVDEIKFYAEEYKVDLLVMGMQGAGYLTEKLIGSVTTSLIEKSKCPVLAIDKHVKFKSVKRIVLACDYDEIEDREIFEPLKEFAHIFKSHIYILNVERKQEHAMLADKVVKDFMKLEYTLADTNHTFHFLDNEDVVEGINKFVKESEMDMVVMIPRKHSILKNIFSEPNTSRMAFHSKVPLLALH